MQIRIWISTLSSRDEVRISVGSGIAVEDKKEFRNNPTVP
jgi:hypothetical protein